MVNTRMKPILPLLALAVAIALVSAPPAEARGELKSWSKKILREKKNEINRILGKNVVIVHKLVANKKPSFARLPFAAPNTKRDGYFASPHPFDFDANFVLNYPYTKKKQVPVETWLQLIRTYLSPDMLIYNDRKAGDWRILEGDALDDDLFVAKAPTKSRKVSYSKLRSYLVKVYGFEGVVIDRRDDAILALVLPASIRKGSQATLIKDSEDKRTISKKDKRVDGILQLTEFDKASSTAIFKMVFRKKSTPIPFGTKLFIQKK